ncbi:hypothetical protein H9K76_01150 [Diaphorobacter ruginosibacter]|uniref:Uncharacterized protein n=1 Tax=Diaphorobacter ruginosibacter TaxID=1715720 RepID=A0A7G9RPL7_9BURK|nr:hypothetical protein [Diaphorobacter ruginosibacter]QNN57542.1 hypothetical protein H9K76_01150 [Diaphorobacter ruginosibacter]
MTTGSEAELDSAEPITTHGVARNVACLAGSGNAKWELASALSMILACIAEARDTPAESRSSFLMWPLRVPGRLDQ